MTSKPMMQWAPSPRSFEGKLHADRCTVEYFGHGNHSADAVRFRTARSVAAAAAPAGDLASPSEQIFYLELLVLSTSKEDEDEDGAEAGIEYLSRSRVRNSEGGSSSSSSRAHSEQVHPYHSSSSAAAGPWRVRARRLVSTHLQSTEPAVFQAFPADQQEAETGQANGNGSTSRNRRSPPPPPRLPVPLSSSSSDRLLRAQQIAQVSLPFAFTLHSRTLLQMPTRSSDRHRLRRAREKKRLNHRICIGFALAKDDDIKKYKPAAARARMAESLSAVQSMGDHNSHQEDLGTTVHSLAYVGKTGRVLSNGQIYLQCEPYGAGDVVGVGLVRDSHMFFFTRNGKLVGTLPASDLPHLEAFTTEEPEHDDGGKDEPMNGSSMSDADWPETAPEPLYPAVSLHEAGECVRLIPDASDWRFDLASFQTQIQSERQQALQEYAAEQNEPQQQDEEERVIHVLLRDYFQTYGYGSAYEAFQQATGLADDSDSGKKQTFILPSSSNNNDNESSNEGDASSLRFRHEIRQLIYAFQTAQALDRVRKTCVRCSAIGRSWLWFACDLLSVIDVLTYAESKPASTELKNGKSSAWDIGGAIALAQTLLHPYTTVAQSAKHAVSIRQDLAQFMSLLLYSSRETVPETSSALRFLSFSFREQVADELNAFLLNGEDQDASCPSSAMDLFLMDLQSLQRKCLQHRAHAFPGAHATASKSTSRKRRSRRKSSMSSSSSGSSYDPEEREAAGSSSQSDDDDLDGSDGHDTE